jgi:hypothetical protein
VGECNPACQKIIINTGFMAPLARLFADTVRGEHPLNALNAPALRLARTAQAATEVFAHALATGAMVKTGTSEFDGCVQAEALSSWIESASANREWSAAEVADVSYLMAKWRSEISAAVAALVKR